uniref:Integrator complex subunit 1 n=1 Tax=Phallusia mammillata TaxID=59560 RepID=A0A6F9DEN6_9ASCI|nr:integrator complex subunit 1 [Phallusia mammillata]
MSTMKRTGLGGGKRIARTASSTRPTQPHNLSDQSFIALGTKNKPTYAIGSGDGLPPGKKLKPSGTPSHPHLYTMAPMSRLATPVESSRMSPTIPEPSAPCIDCAPAELVDQVLKYVDVDQDHVEGLLCGAIQTLRLNKNKPDMTTILSMFYLAKERPDMFKTEAVIEHLASLLKKDLTPEPIKSKGVYMLAIMSCNIINAVLELSEDWPDLLAKVFLDDSLADRVWVDHPECQVFVRNILTAFGTKVNDRSEGDSDIVMTDLTSKEASITRFQNTAEVQHLAIDILKDRLSRRIPDINPVGGGAGPGASAVGMSGRSLIKTLASTCGVQEIRSMSSQKLEMWLQNPKLVKPAQDLLMAICMNCKSHSQEDVDTIGNLTKMRLKSKPLLNFYLICLKELIDAHPDNLKTMFSYVLYNELSNARHPGNMAVVVSTLQNFPEIGAKTLASVSQDLLLQQEDYLRAVRALLREIVRAIKHEIRFNALAIGLMQEPDMDKFNALDQPHKDRFVSSTADLICLTMLLSITPEAREALSVINGKRKSESSVVNVDECYSQIKLLHAEIQHDALWWMHMIVIPRLNSRMTPAEFIQLLQKILFLKPADTYHIRDNWPPEVDRAFLIKSCHDSAMLEGSLLRLAAIGLSPEHPLAPAEALDLIGQLVRRAAVLTRHSFNPLTVERSDVIDTILALCQYHHPGNIKLPSEYIPPSLAISQLYWTALQSLLIIICLNPNTIGQQAWTTYPMLKVLMEMAIVNRFTYPPVTVVDEEMKNQMIGKEHQMATLEKAEILEFESHLAAVTTRQVITEESSLLLSQLIAMDPQGHPRRPPDRVLEQVGQLSYRLQLGVWLCRSRQPDFLLDIINRHGENQSMSWLPDLVASAKGDVGRLPVQCLCEFLLVQDSEVEKLSSGGIHTEELISQLQQLLLQDNYDESVQVIQYFLKRLYSPQIVTREKSRIALSMILSNIGDEQPMEMEKSDNEISYKWLLHDLVQLPQYATMLRLVTVDAIRNAVLIAAEPLAVAAYVTFLANDLQFEATGGDREQMLELSTGAARMASHLLIDRRIVVQSTMDLTSSLASDAPISACQSFVTSLLHIFVTHIRHALEHDARRINADAEAADRIPWSDSQDEIYVKWPNFGAATLHILVPQASIILLGFGPPSYRTQQGAMHSDQADVIYHQLMGYWFSEEGYVIPQAYLMDTQEEALLLPDWLRLRMLGSEVTPSTRRLAFAAVRDLEVGQLILFIQSFGIPVASMDLLLQVLDSQCETNAEVILNATSSNSSYMVRLIEVQGMRGCKAGSKFRTLLKSRSEESTQVAAGGRPSVIKMASQSMDNLPSAPTKMEIDFTESETVIKRKFPPNSLTAMKERLNKLFSPKESSYDDWMSLLQSINRPKSPNLKHPTSHLCVNALFQLINTDFISSLFKTPSRSCSLMRALDRDLGSLKQKQAGILDKFAQIMNKIYEHGKKLADESKHKARALVVMATSWQARHESVHKGIRPRRLSSTSEGGDNLRQSDWSRLEEFLREQMVFLDNDEEIKSKVALVAQILLEEIGHRHTLIGRGKSISDDLCFTSVGTSGLLVDWLQLLDPELLAHCPHLQRKLLFEKNETSSPQSASSVFNQAYLLSLLVQHCNWSTIHNSIQWLLSDETPDPTDDKQSPTLGVNAKTALDFLWVVIQAPKIWQGRENKSTRVNEPVLRLTPGQFCRLLSYIVAATANHKSGDSLPPDGFSYLELFSVYFSKFAQDRASRPHMAYVVEFVRRKLDTSKPHSDIWWQILAQIYIFLPNHPSCSQLHQCSGVHSSKPLTQSELCTFADAVASAKVGSNCRTDALLCSLLNRLGYVRSSSSISTQVNTSMIMTSLDAACDANLLLCKIASARPFLLLRKLELLSSMLRGRTRHDFSQFKLQHHLPLMLNTATLLKQLSPFLFQPLHEVALSGIMETFWQMVRNYCHRARRQMLPVLTATLSLTHDYLTHCTSRATAILSRHAATFQTLHRTYHDHDHIVTLVNTMQSVVGSPWSGSLETTTLSHGSIRPPVLSIPSTLANSQPNSVYLDLLAKGQDLQNILQALADFDESSKRRVDDLTPFLPELIRHFSESDDRSVRKSAIGAAVRHARADPNCATKLVLPRFLSCLREAGVVNGDSGGFSHNAKRDLLSRSLLNDSANMARDIIQYLPEMTILCREDAALLLGAAYDAGARCGAALAYPEPMSGDVRADKKDFSDVSDILARCFWLMCGFNENDMRGVSS